MIVYKLLFASLGLFALLHYLVIPEVRRKWGFNRTLLKIGKAGIISALEFARTAALLAAAAYVFVLVVAWVLSLTSASTAERLAGAISRVQGYRAAVAAFQDYWGVWVFALLLVALFVLAYRRGRRQHEERFQAAVNREYERLRREREEGRWKDLPPTAEMEAIEERLRWADGALFQLENGDAPRGAEFEANREMLRLFIQTLEQRWHSLDWLRRMNLTWDDADEPAAPRVKGWRARAQTFVVSRGLLSSLRGGSRVLGHAGMVLLFLSLVGVNASSLSTAFASRVVRLDELQVKASEQEARESFARLQAERKDGGKQELDEEDEAALDDLARRFEDAFASSGAWRASAVPRPAAAELRRMNVRGRILQHVRTAAPAGGDVGRPRPRPPRGPPRPARSNARASISTSAPHTSAGRRRRSAGACAPTCAGKSSRSRAGCGRASRPS